MNEQAKSVVENGSTRTEVFERALNNLENSVGRLEGLVSSVKNEPSSGTTDEKKSSYSLAGLLSSGPESLDLLGKRIEEATTHLQEMLL